MTPLKLALLQIIAIALFSVLLAAYREGGSKRVAYVVKWIVGLLLFSVFGTATWAVFYYL